MGTHKAEPISISMNHKTELDTLSYLSLSITLKHESQCTQINQRKDVLRSLDVAPLVCKTVQLLVDPDMCARVYQRPCATHNILVVSFSFQVNLNLLHICCPVNLCVCKSVSYADVEHVFS
jgi:hypothetical protein